MDIVRTDLPMTSALAEQTILQLTQAFPSFRTQVLTRTAFGRPLRALVLGRGPRRVLFTAAHHANEWITATVLLKFAQELGVAARDGGLLCGVDARALLQQTAVYMVPMVDPDGVDLVTGQLQPGQEQYDRAAALAREYPDIAFPEGWKANLIGVDLNLNYPAGWLQAREIKYLQGYTGPAPRDYVGRAPLDQAESFALAAYTRLVDPALVLAYHTQGRVIYWQFEDRPVPGARELAERFAAVSGYAVADTPYESAFAGYKDWFIKTFGRPGFTVEAGQGQNPLPLSQFEEIYRDNLGILVTAAAG